MLCSPLQLVVVSKQSVRACKWEVRPQTWALCDIKCIIKCYCHGRGNERDGKEVAIHSICPSTRIIQRLSRTAFGIVDMCNYWVPPKHLAKDFRIPRSLSDSNSEIATISFHDGRIGGKVCIDKIGGEFGMHRLVELGVRIQDEGATHNITSATKHLCEASADHVAMWQDSEVDKGPHSVIYHQQKFVLFGQLMQAFQVWWLQKRIPWKFANECMDLSSGRKILFERIQVFPRRMAVQCCFEVIDLLERLYGINI